MLRRLQGRHQGWLWPSVAERSAMQGRRQHGPREMMGALQKVCGCRRACQRRGTVQGAAAQQI